MRLFLRDSERRPDPLQVQTDDRKAMLSGLAAWGVGVVAVLLGVVPLSEDKTTAVLWCILAGLVLGLIGLAYTHLLQRSDRRKDR